MPANCARLKGSDCRAYMNNMRVAVPDKGMYSYPDVVVVCGQPIFEDEERDIPLNPR